MGVITRSYKVPWGDKFGFGAFGCGRKMLVTEMLVAGSGTTWEGECLVTGVDTAVDVGNDPDGCGDIGVYGGGGAGFITTSGGGPPRFFFSEVVLEGLGVGEVED